MRKLLLRAQELMLLAFDNKLNMNIWTRIDQRLDTPWFTGCISEEGCSYSNREEDGVRYQYFYVYDHNTYEENSDNLDVVEEFINKHIK